MLAKVCFDTAENEPAKAVFAPPQISECKYHTSGSSHGGPGGRRGALLQDSLPHLRGLPPVLSEDPRVGALVLLEPDPLPVLVGLDDRVRDLTEGGRCGGSVLRLAVV